MEKFTIQADLAEKFDVTNADLKCLLCCFRSFASETHSSNGFPPKGREYLPSIARKCFCHRKWIETEEKKSCYRQKKKFLAQKKKMWEQMVFDT